MRLRSWFLVLSSSLPSKTTSIPLLEQLVSERLTMKPQPLALIGLLTIAFLVTTSIRLTADDTLSLCEHKNISALWIAAP